MIKLLPYTDKYENIAVNYIISFFDFHSSLSGKTESPEYIQAKENIVMWTSKSHELYIIEDIDNIVGFIHIWYKGGNVAWIEDIFVDEAYRGKGIGSQAINVAEEIIKKKDGYSAVCIDVVPKNTNALNLYYKLGYDTLNMITVRKEFNDNYREEIANVLGHKFKI